MGCEMALTCAVAESMLAPGWKKILTMERPEADVDSMCSMSLTVVVTDQLKRPDDALFHLLGIEACIAEYGRDHGNIDVGKDVGGRAQDDDRT